jgi:hypothetical protein
MEIVGSGFLAGNLARIAERHPEAVVLSAGVSSTHVTSAAEFTREQWLTRDVAVPQGGPAYLDRLLDRYVAHYRDLARVT